MKVELGLLNQNVTYHFDEVYNGVRERESLKYQIPQRSFGLTVSQQLCRADSHNKGHERGFPPETRASGLTRSLGFSIRPHRGGTRTHRNTDTRTDIH